MLQRAKSDGEERLYGLEQSPNAEEELGMAGIAVGASDGNWTKQRIHLENSGSIAFDGRRVRNAVRLSYLGTEVKVKIPPKERRKLRQRMRLRLHFPSRISQ